MTYYFTNMKNKSLTFRCSTRFWSDILDLAQQHDWVAQGARLVSHPEETVQVSPYGEEIAPDETYQFDSGWFVTEHDAAQLVKACERLDAVLLSTNINSDKLQEFITFAKHGAFEIG